MKGVACSRALQPAALYYVGSYSSHIHKLHKSSSSSLSTALSTFYLAFPFLPTSPLYSSLLSPVTNHPCLRFFLLSIFFAFILSSFFFVFFFYFVFLFFVSFSLPLSFVFNTLPLSSPSYREFLSFLPLPFFVSSHERPMASTK